MNSTSCSSFETIEWAEEISQEKRRRHDLEQEMAQRAVEARQRVQERINTGQHDPITATREAYSVEVALSQWGYMQKGHKWLSPNSGSKIAGVTVKDGKWHSHHDSDSQIGQPAQGGGTWGDAFDLEVHYRYGGNFGAAVQAMGDQYTIQDPVKGDITSINKFNQREYMREKSTEKDFDDFSQPQQQPQPTPNIITLGELRTKNPQSIPLIDGVLNKGEGLLIHAIGGLGKSMFALWIAIQIALSRIEPLFGTFPPMRRTTSMFIQTENSGATINARIRKMVGSNPDHIEALNYITMPLIHDDVLTSGSPFSNPDFQKWLIAAVNESGQRMGQPVDILWIDPLISFSAGDENDSAKMRQELDALNEICRRCGVTPIVIHHDNRNGDYRGSSAIFDWCRAMIGLKAEFIGSDRVTDIQGDDVTHRTASVPCIRIIHEKANNMKKFAPFLARMDQHLNFQKIEEATSPEHMEQGLFIQQAMKDMGSDAVSRIDLINTYTSLSGLSKATARRHIKTATDNHFISMKSTTKGGQQVYEYILSN